MHPTEYGGPLPNLYKSRMMGAVATPKLSMFITDEHEMFSFCPELKACLKSLGRS